jgi:hypothetical protein
LVTTAFKNPTMPVAGVATRAAGTAGGADTATIWVGNAVLAVLAEKACAARAVLGSVIVVDGFVATLTASTELAGDDGNAVALPVAAWAESDSVLAGVDVGCSVSGAGAAGGVLGTGSAVSPEAGSLGSDSVSTPLVSSSDSSLGDVGAVDGFDSVVLVCAPPLLLMVTPEVDPPLVEVEPAPVVAVDVPVVPVVGVAADSVDDSPDDVVLDVELVDADSDDDSVVSAVANP